MKGEQQQTTIGIIAALLLIFLSLVAVPVIPFGFETPKVLLFELITLGIFLSLLFKGVLTISSGLGVGVGVTLLLIFTSVTFHSSETTWFHNPVRMQGLFLQCMFVLWMLSSSSIVDKFSLKYSPLIGLILLVLSGFLLQDPVTGRSIGLIGEPNSFTGMCVLLGIFSLVALKNSKNKKIIFTTIIILVSTAILFSGSRSSLLAGILSLGMFGLIQTQKISVRNVVIVGSIFLFCTLPLPFFSTENPWENRAMIWQTAVASGLESPLTGHGFGNITQALKNTSEQLQNEVRFQHVDSSHNVLLDWWVQGGIIGVSTLLYCTLFSIKTYIRAGSMLELTLLFACLQLMLFNPVSIVILSVFWWCIGRGFIAIRNINILL